MDASRSRWRSQISRWGILSLKIPSSPPLACKISNTSQWRAVCWHTECLEVVRADVSTNVRIWYWFFFLLWAVLSAYFFFHPQVEKLEAASWKRGTLQQRDRSSPCFPFFSFSFSDSLFSFNLVLYNGLKLWFLSLQRLKNKLSQLFVAHCWILFVYSHHKDLTAHTSSWDFWAKL